MLTAAQCRMARSALRWTLQEVADKAGVSRATLTRFEAEQGTPIAATLKVVRQAFETAGIEFRPDGCVRLREAADAQS
jgi:transcriptional regulator with XRE-family HTH domain